MGRSFGESGDEKNRFIEGDMARKMDFPGIGVKAAVASVIGWISKEDTPYGPVIKFVGVSVMKSENTIALKSTSCTDAMSGSKYTRGLGEIHHYSGHP